jgi:hypothetical protein
LSCLVRTCPMLRPSVLVLSYSETSTHKRYSPAQPPSNHTTPHSERFSSKTDSHHYYQATAQYHISAASEHHVPCQSSFSLPRSRSRQSSFSLPSSTPPASSTALQLSTIAPTIFFMTWQVLTDESIVEAADLGLVSECDGGG